MNFKQKIPTLLVLLLLLAAASVAAENNCVKTNSEGFCILCSSGKVAFNGKCVDSILHCLEFDDKGICSKCELGFSLASNGKCNLQSNPKFIQKSPSSYYHWSKPFKMIHLIKFKAHLNFIKYKCPPTPRSTKFFEISTTTCGPIELCMNSQVATQNHWHK